MARAQGSLEYLIIISIAISITAVVTLLTVNYFSGQQDQYYYSSCRSAASTCKLLQSVDPLNTCDGCNVACNYSDGTEIFTGAIDCCKFAQPDEIYPNAPACAPPTVCGDSGLICPSGYICCESYSDASDICCAPDMYPTTYCVHNGDGDPLCFWQSSYPR